MQPKQMLHFRHLWVDGIVESVEMNTAVEQVVEDESLYARSEESTDENSDFVVYENDKEELTEYELDKKLGPPHPFIDPKVRKPINEPLTSEELWWNWRKSEKEQWSRWQKKRPDAETVAAISEQSSQEAGEVLGTEKPSSRPLEWNSFDIPQPT